MKSGVLVHMFVPAMMRDRNAAAADARTPKRTFGHIHIAQYMYTTYYSIGVMKR